MSQESGTCWSCAQPLSYLEYGRGDRCQKCGRDTRVCKGCVHYDRSAYNECREPQADRVVDKERSNFCDYFRPKSGGAQGGEDPVAKAKAAAEALFKK